MKRKTQTRKFQKRKGGYRANNSWILKPLTNSNIQVTTYVSHQKNGEKPTASNLLKPEVQYVERTTSIGNSNTVQSYESESIRSSSPTISPARTPISSVESFALPSQRESFQNHELMTGRIIEPSVVTYGASEFKNVPLQYKGIAPVVVGAETSQFIPETPTATEGNYSYVKNQVGPYSQNKVKNSLKKRVKTFLTGPPRNPYTKGPVSSEMSKLRKSRKTRRTRK